MPDIDVVIKNSDLFTLLEYNFAVFLLVINSLNTKNQRQSFADVLQNRCYTRVGASF